MRQHVVYYYHGVEIYNVKIEHQVYSLRLPSASSIFNAEANAILLALKFVASSDSLSCLLAIESCKTLSPFSLKKDEIYKSFVAIGKMSFFTWIPSQINIHGNTVFDQEAKDALDDPISNCSIPFSDLKPYIMKYSETAGTSTFMTNCTKYIPSLAGLPVLKVKIGNIKQF